MSKKSYIIRNQKLKAGGNVTAKEYSQLSDCVCSLLHFHAKTSDGPFSTVGFGNASNFWTNMALPRAGTRVKINRTVTRYIVFAFSSRRVPIRRSIPVRSRRRTNFNNIGDSYKRPGTNFPVGILMRTESTAEKFSLNYAILRGSIPAGSSRPSVHLLPPTERNTIVISRQ